ncbi:XrtA/PEP-CTERM system histidine kinase PrsK [Erythrobacter sp. YT30]|uniref:XrtA/PEP-CTERM system histidine kinase PrsK n=1 Tax=Erythrobacter sp. YT30 TaxID=1735012 RepID=UPI00076C51C1|nr:XrtA/PEP-CTERM system histidine kinase PrsK [Erythrobacter sp. YT30]KWV92819.1 histidine kinase [Erythrobacter sp. YT30]
MAELFGIPLDFAAVCAVIGAVLSGIAGLWIVRFGDRKRVDWSAALAVVVLTAVWCILGAAIGFAKPATMVAETARNLAMIAVIFRLFSADGRDESLKPTRPVLISLALVQMFQPLLVVIDQRMTGLDEVSALIFEVATLLSMLVSIGALVLLHNLYVGAAAGSRRFLRWSAIGLAGIFAFDLNLYTLAYLLGEQPAILSAMRTAVSGAMVVLIALSSNAKGANRNFNPSRAVTFQTLSLLVIGSYLLAMVLVTRSLALLGGDIARASQIVFVVLAVLFAIVWLPSQKLRAWLRVTATKHLFQHRYDYREEWLRFTQTMGRSASNGPSFHERSVKAMADITESPAGLLLTPNEEAELELTARWNWATIEVPANAGGFALAGLLERHAHILDLDETRGGIDRHGELEHVPSWLKEAEDAWALVPLIHFDRLVGAIVLARPRIERRLDWEDFDLLRVAGQQLASYLAEQAGQQALMDASRFDEFNRRMAFVMHDIKNLASQMSLLATNAEKHADNPAFRKDMLVTLRNSSDKLGALLARLGRYGSGQAKEPVKTNLSHVAKALCKRFEAVHPVKTDQVTDVYVLADPEALEQALIHLVQNAIDASEPDAPILLSVRSERLSGVMDIIDTGTGMTPEFVRSGLFKPFVSSKQSGFGIGAFEAREMVKAMAGRVSVESREGLGTRFTVSLPLSDTASLIETGHSADSDPNQSDKPKPVRLNNG